jgi:uncharacterized membrane protein
MKWDVSNFGPFTQILMLCGYTMLVLMATSRPGWVVYLKKIKNIFEGILVLYSFSVVLCVLTIFGIVVGSLVVLFAVLC